MVINKNRMNFEGRQSEELAIFDNFSVLPLDLLNEVHRSQY